MDYLSNELISEELRNEKSERVEILRQFEDAKKETCEIFGTEEGEIQILRHEKHFLKVMKIRNTKIEKKFFRDVYLNTKDEKVENEVPDFPSFLNNADFSKKKKRTFKRKYNQQNSKNKKRK